MRSWRRWAVVVLGVGLLLQLVPLGAWRHGNPPVVSAAVFPDAATEDLARRSCMDCHSHEVRYPPQAWVAPASWLVQRDVDEGRDEMNLSVWDPDDGEDAAETILDGEMPPRRYTLLHPDAALSDDEARALAAAFVQMAARDR